jgi:hypothetical protein
VKQTEEEMLKVLFSQIIPEETSSLSSVSKMMTSQSKRITISLRIVMTTKKKRMTMINTQTKMKTKVKMQMA